MSTGGPASQAKVLAADRRLKAMNMRRLGATYDKIGNALGISTQAAAKSVKRGMALLRKQTEEEAELIRQLDLDRLDGMMFGVYPTASKGSLGAIDRVIRIMERRAKILGTDAPTKVAPTNPDGVTPYEHLTEHEVDRRLDALIAKYAPARTRGSHAADRDPGGDAGSEAGGL